MASLLSPVLRLYQFILYPVAKSSALLLDTWPGKESVQYFAEKNLNLFLRKHGEATESEIDFIEGTGAKNFLSRESFKIREILNFFFLNHSISRRIIIFVRISEDNHSLLISICENA